MKLHLKYIVTLVITALVCIFAYQTYWLVGLYQSQKKEVEAKIKGGMEYAHFMEMKKRIERLRNDDKGPHRQLTGAVAFSMDEDDDIDQKVKVKKFVEERSFSLFKQLLPSTRSVVKMTRTRN